MNTFDGTVMEFQNLGIHFMLAEVIKFRIQLTKRINSEFKGLSGWGDAMNKYMVDELDKIADTLENITYHPRDETQEELEALAADTNRSLADDYSDRVLHEDDVLGPVELPRIVRWKLDDSDLDIPQLTSVNCPNDVALSFITGLDRFFVQMTRLDSRHQPNMITKFESVNMRNYLVTLYTLCQRKGGEENKSDIPSGVLNKDEPETFKG
jgi:hypothetical protein